MTGTTAAAMRSTSRKRGWRRANSGTLPAFDRASGNSSFAYAEGGRPITTIWLLDAASAYNEIGAAAARWASAASRCGGWVARIRASGRSSGAITATLPDPPAIDAMPAGTNVDIEGAGEILQDRRASRSTGHRRAVRGAGRA